MTTTTEAERLLDLCLMTAYAARSAAAAQRAPCYQALLAELRRMAAEVQRLDSERQNSHEAWVALSDHAEKLRAENEALRRGECICKRCGLRQPGESAGPAPF